MGTTFYVFTYFGRRKFNSMRCYMTAFTSENGRFKFDLALRKRMTFTYILSVKKRNGIFQLKVTVISGLYLSIVKITNAFDQKVE